MSFPCNELFFRAWGGSPSLDSLPANLDNTQFQYERLLGAGGSAGDFGEAFSENCAQTVQSYQLTASKDQKGIGLEVKQ
jgi:hypothetical protein